MRPFLALLAFLQSAHLAVQPVRIPEADGTVLDAALVTSDRPARAPAIVALHGCGGPYPSRDGSWAVTLARGGIHRRRLNVLCGAPGRMLEVIAPTATDNHGTAGIPRSFAPILLRATERDRSRDRRRPWR